MDLNDEMVHMVSRVSRTLHRRFDVCPLEDIQQELYAFVFGNPDKVNEWQDTEQMGKLNRALWYTGLDYCQVEKAALLGYKDEDNYYYNTRTVVYLLREIFSTVDNFDELTKQELPDKEAVLDVTNAFIKAPKEDRDLLWGVLTCTAENAHAHMAEVWGVTEDLVRGRYKRSLRRIQRTLGGEAPDQQYRRRARSNAAAQVQTRKEYLGE